MNITGKRLSDAQVLKDSIDGDILFPTHLAFKSNSKVFNRAIHNTPILIAKVKCELDIKKVVIFAKKHGLQISTRCGGHSLTGSSIKSQSIVIDLKALNSVAINKTLKTAVVQGGALIEDVDKKTSAFDIAIPMGTCKSVGVMGASLGGGFGFLSRKYGLMSDNLLGVKIIDANAETLHVDANNHSDLFWALKGGGAIGLGVVVEAKYQAHCIPKEIFGGTISWHLKHAHKILTLYSKIMAQADDNLFLYAYIGHHSESEPVVSIFGCDFSSLDASQKVFNEFLSVAQPCHQDFRARPYFDLQSGHYEDSYALYWKHGLVNVQLKERLISQIVDAIEACPDFLGGIMLDPLGGQINNVPATSSAFIHRDSNFIVSVTGINTKPYVPKATANWVKDTYLNMQRFFSEYKYQNYLDPDITRLDAYFGVSTSKLLAVKEKYDPNKLFVNGIF
jgi:hypothetical protein